MYIRGSWCTKCPRSTSTKAKDKFLQIVSEKGGTLLTEYIKADTHVTIRCAFGHEWSVRPHQISGIANSWCPACYGNCPKQAAEKFYNIVKDRGGIVLENYETSYKKIKIKCFNGHEWDCTPHSIVSGSWCNKCYGRCPVQAEEKFRKIVNDKGGTVLGEYINAVTHVKIKCRVNHEWNCRPDYINSGGWCPACSGRCPIEAYKRFVSIVEKHGGVILGNYLDTMTKISIRCKQGHIWDTFPNNISNTGSWCPVCNESHGERTVRHILEKHNISCVSQKTHPLLSNKHFDFYFSYNEKEFYLEYDGRQHFERSMHFCKTEEDYQYRRNIDILKSQTVVRNGGYLIRLDYTLTEAEIETHILTALQGTNPVYLSNPIMYVWIIERINNQNLVVSAEPITTTKPIHTVPPVTNTTTETVTTTPMLRLRVQPIILPALHRLTLNVIKPIN